MRTVTVELSDDGHYVIRYIKEGTTCVIQNVKDTAADALTLLGELITPVSEKKEPVLKFLRRKRG